MTEEDEIRAEYNRMGQSMTRVTPFTYGKQFNALSQYGYDLMWNFNSVESAEKYVIEYYSGENMKYIRQ